MAQPKAKPGALPPQNTENPFFHDLGNCGVVCPTPAEGEKINHEPIQQPTRPLKNTEKIHCAPSVGKVNRSYAPTNYGTGQGSLGGTNLTRIGPEQNIHPPHSDVTMGFDAPGHQPKGGCLHQMDACQCMMMDAHAWMHVNA